MKRFASLLQDHETEVRAATIKDISSFVDLVGPPTFASEVMPYVLALLQDVNLVSVVQRHVFSVLSTPFMLMFRKKYHVTYF